MPKATPSILMLIGTALFAMLMTAVVSGVWSGLLLANLALSPVIPWAAVVMGLLLWVLWRLLDGRWGPSAGREARRVALRGEAAPLALSLWAVIAGVSWIVALAGFWIVLHQLVATHSNPLPDFSKLPQATVIVSLAMASISGALSEEAGFRGYFQGALERRGLGLLAIVIQALVMAPEHALTQGFVWPNILFYLLVDGMLGALVYVTRSIRPGIVVHAIGLFVFFALVWPHDAGRRLVAASGADRWFWIHVGQTAVFGLLSLLAFAHLVRLAARARVKA